MKELYLNSLASRGLSTRTGEIYASGIDKLQEIVNKPYEQVTKTDLLKFASELSSRYSQSSVNRFLSGVKSYYHFLAEIGEIPEDPATILKLGKVQQTRIEVLESDELTKVLNRLPETSTELRDTAIFATFIYTGMRCGELRNLKVTNVDLEKSRISIEKGKTGFRLVPIHSDLSPFLERYMDEFYKLELDMGIHSTEDFLFKTRGGRQMQECDVCVLLKSLAKKSNCTEKTVALIRPHLLRHSSATLYIQRNVSLLAVQQLLGHSSVKMTERYLHMGTDYVQESINNTKI